MAKVLIVGAGAAGLMAAGAAVRQGHQVTVLEHTDKPGQKILVTGKGRCNVTNDCPAEEFLRHVRTNPRFLYSSLGAFPPAKTMELFEALGVELKVERGRRVFPVSDKAEEIRQALPRRHQSGCPGSHDQNPCHLSSSQNRLLILLYHTRNPAQKQCSAAGKEWMFGSTPS